MATLDAYTPGPWAVHPLKAQVCAAGGVPVCKLLWPTEERSEAETEANADLIAAAPEMRETLDRIMSAAGNPDPAEGCRIIIALAHAAIAKAEGQR